MRPHRSRLYLLALSSFIAACREVPSAQLVVVVDTNLTEADDLRSIQIEAQTPDGASQRVSSFELIPTGPVRLPLSFGVVPAGGDLSRRVRIIARALNSSGVTLVQRSALSGFLADRALRLPLYLPNICRGLVCPPGTTCRGDARVCVSDEVQPQRLNDVTGQTGGGELDGGKKLPFVAPDVTIAPDAADATAAPDAADATAAPDAADATAAFVAPRLVAPLSLGRITSLAPTFYFRRGTAARVRVEICRDRSCASPLQNALGSFDTVQMAGTLPPNSLLYWRVVPIDAAGAPIGDASPVWYFRTPAASLGTDTSYRAQTDMNGDGRADLALLGITGTRPTMFSVVSGVGFPTRSTELVRAAMPCDACTAEDAASAAGDVTGDGTSDFLWAFRGAPRLFVIDANLRTSVVPFALAGAATVLRARIVGDLNRDGYADVAVSVLSPPPEQSSVRVYYGGAEGLSATRVEVLTAPAGEVWGDDIVGGGADFDGDGYHDLAYTVRTRRGVRLNFGHADGAGPRPAFERSSLALATDTAEMTALAAGDFNADGRSDLAYVTGMRSDTAARTSIFTTLFGDAALGLGIGFSLVRTLTIPGRMSVAYLGSLLVGDFNRDGADDIVRVDRSGDALPFTYSRINLAGVGGSSTTGMSVGVPLPLDGRLVPYFASPGDLDGNGFDDMIYSARRVADTGVVLLAGGETALTAGAGVYVPYAGVEPVTDVRAVE